MAFYRVGGDTTDEAEEIIVEGLQFCGRVVGQAEQFDGVVVEFPFYVAVVGTIDLDDPVDPFESTCGVVIGEILYRSFDGDELGFIVVVAVEAGCQLLARLVLEIVYQYPIAKPVKKEYSQQQYSGKPFQTC